MRVRADMPVDRTPRGRGWAVAVLGLIIIALAFGAAEVLDAARPSGYRGAYMNPADWVYPSDEVRTWLTAIGCETLIACLVLAARTRISIGARAMLLAGLLFCGILLLGVFAMHAASPFIDYLLFMLFASVFLGVFAIVSMVVHYVEHRRRI